MRPRSSFGIVLALILVLRGAAVLADSLCANGSGSGCGDLRGPIFFVGYSTEGSPCAWCWWWDGACGSNPSQVRVSSSPTDPYANSGPLPPDGDLYLWLARAGTGYFYGFDAVSLSFEGDIVVQDFVPASPEWAVEFYKDDHLYLNTDCFTEAPAILGRLVLDHPVSVDSFNWGRVKALYR